MMPGRIVEMRLRHVLADMLNAQQPADFKLFELVASNADKTLPAPILPHGIRGA
jgi:hypothetical protein